MDSEVPDEPERDNCVPTWVPNTDEELPAEIGFSPTPLDRARDAATEVIADALHESLQSSGRLRNQRSTLWEILWRPLDAERRLAQCPTDPCDLRRWPALIDDLRRHVRRALPNRENREAWPPDEHVIWREGLGILLGRDDLGEAAALLHDMPGSEFAKLVKHAWVVGPRLERSEWAPVPLSELLSDKLLAFPAKTEDGDEPSHAMAVWNWSITRLKNEKERAARDSLKRKLGPKVWHDLTTKPIAKLPSLLQQAVADEIGTKRLTATEKQLLAEAQSKGLLSGPGEQLRWNLSAGERSALRELMDEVRHYGRRTEFIEEFLIRDGRRTKLRALPDHPIRQDLQVRAAVTLAYQALAVVSSDPLGELVDVILTRTSLRVVWGTQDWDQAKDDAAKHAARLRLREMLRRRVKTE